MSSVGIDKMIDAFAEASEPLYKELRFISTELQKSRYRQDAILGELEAITNALKKTEKVEG